MHWQSSTTFTHIFIEIIRRIQEKGRDNGKNPDKSSHAICVALYLLEDSAVRLMGKDNFMPSGWGRRREVKWCSHQSNQEPSFTDICSNKGHPVAILLEFNNQTSVSYIQLSICCHMTTCRPAVLNLGSPGILGLQLLEILFSTISESFWEF